MGVRALDFLLSTGRADPGASFGGGGPEAGLDAVLRAFAKACERIAAATGGSVTIVSSHAEAEAASRRARPADACVHLCFAPPDECVEVTGCRTVPVFGCGLEHIPTQAGQTPGPDWRQPLGRFGRAICLSRAAAAAVTDAMGPDFAVCAITPPAMLPAGLPARLRAGAVIGSFSMLDTATWTQHRPPVVAFDAADDLADVVAATPAEEVLFRTPPPWRKTLRYRLGTTRLHAREWYRDAVQDLVPARVSRAGAAAGRGLARAAKLGLLRKPDHSPLPLALPGGGEAAAAPAWPVAELSLSGTVFAAVHGMWDRSWSDAISAFVWTFRHQPDATLLIRSAGIDSGTRESLAAYLRRLLPFRCRVVLLDARLSPNEADALIDACAYYVCASHAEAAPLPLIGFMARGRPAVSPVHGALADIVDEDNALLVAASLAHDYWPGDPGERLLTRSHRLDWESLCQAFARAHALAAEPDAYARKQHAAMRRLAQLNAEGDRTLARFVGVRVPDAVRQTA